MRQTYRYTCNGSLRGCERERFGVCGWCDRAYRYSLTFELDGATRNRTIAADGPTEACEQLLFIFEQARIVSVVDVTQEQTTAAGCVGTYSQSPTESNNGTK